MKVAVVILNYNGRKFLEQFLPNVIANCDPTLAEIVVADNASTDDSVAFMREHYPEIRLIENGTNGGFATGYNVALRQIEAQYYVLLNSDIEVAPRWIEPVIEMMDANLQIAACQPKILSYYNKERFEYWRLTSISMMCRKKCFGPRVPACLSVPICIIRLVVWTTASLPTWRKSTCAGD